MPFANLVIEPTVRIGADDLESEAEREKLAPPCRHGEERRPIELRQSRPPQSDLTAPRDARAVGDAGRSGRQRGELLLEDPSDLAEWRVTDDRQHQVSPDQTSA